MAVAGLVLGIISAAGAFIPFFNFIAWVCGIVGIILSVKARKVQPSGMATAGLVLSIIGTALAVVGLICAIIAIVAVGAVAGSAIDAFGNLKF